MISMLIENNEDEIELGDLDEMLIVFIMDKE